MLAATYGLSVRSVRSGGQLACSRAAAAAVRLSRPAAASVWPTLLLTAESLVGSRNPACIHCESVLATRARHLENRLVRSLALGGPGGCFPEAALAAPTSMGSPRGVPVP